MTKTIAYLYRFRFEIFLAIQCAILFGALIFPAGFYDRVVLPLMYLTSILAGVLMLSKKKKLAWFFLGLFAVSAFIFGSSLIDRHESPNDIFIRLTIYFIFHIVVAWHIIMQVWKAEVVGKNVVLGLMSGYISLGFLGFFLFMSIELTHPGAFQGVILNPDDLVMFSEGIMYYSFITLLTIGYGEIVPVIPIAQKAAILDGLTGQFYLVIITAVVIGKFLKQR